MSNEHPFTLELDSLKAALGNYQHAAHTASLQLQQAHLELSEASARSRLLEADNDRLKHEIAFLRANPEPTLPPPQIAELSLALRRVSDKLSVTEGLLLQRTTQLTHALSEKSQMQLELEATFAEVDRVRRIADEGRSRERELRRKCKAAEEEARMADVVVMEYADLVRSLEGRLTNPDTVSNGTDERSERESREKSQESKKISLSSYPSLVDSSVEPFSQARSKCLLHSLTENRLSLQRLLHEFNSETSNLQNEITRLHTELSTVQNKLDTEREVARLDRNKLAETLVEIERCKTDDDAAGKVVSRYMRFSQSSIDMLQVALSTSKSRHAVALATLSSSSEALSQSLLLERQRASRLRDALDQLTGDISRETFGRRRETALRLQSVVREEKTVEALVAWLRRAEEHRTKMVATIPSTEDAVSSPSLDLSSGWGAIVDRMIQDAHALLASLDRTDYTTGKTLGKDSFLTRVILAEHTCRSLISELQEETEKRMVLTRTTVQDLFLEPRLPLPEGDVRLGDQVTSTLTCIIAPERSQDAAMSSLGPEENSVYESVPPPVTGRTIPLTCDIPSRRHEVEDERQANYRTVSPPKNPCEGGVMLNEGETSTVNEPPLSLPLAPSEESASQLYPLPNDLTHVFHHHDQLQREFRDCHLTLARLKMDISSGSSPPQDISMVRNVIHRLDDFCEDARVELEIRIADGERIARGLEIMLRVPGALGAHDEEKARFQLRSFVEGTDPSVLKAHESFSTKLADLHHDIAQIKRVLHGIETASETQLERSRTPPSWPSWTSPFLSNSPARSSSPAPTFGTVITAPRPRRVSSISILPRTSSESMMTITDPYVHLGLRIPMPSQTLANSSPLHTSSRLSNTKSSNGMYLLGLAGSRSGFLSKQEPVQEICIRGGGENDSDNRQSPSDVE